jgi:hypothetical protein
MNGHTPLALHENCPGGNQSCASNWVKIQEAINSNRRRIYEMEEKQRAMLTAFELRVWVVVAFAFMTFTNPALASILKGLIK